MTENKQPQPDRFVCKCGYSTDMEHLWAGHQKRCAVEREAAAPSAQKWTPLQERRARQTGELLAQKDYSNRAFEIALEIRLASQGQEAAPRDLELENAAKDLLKYLDEHDWGLVPEGQTSDKLRDVLKRRAVQDAAAPQASEPEKLQARIFDLEEERNAHECGFAIENFLNREFELEADPDCAVQSFEGDKPIARIRWHVDTGDASVGIQGWSGFILADDQKGTELEKLLAAKGTQ